MIAVILSLIAAVLLSFSFASFNLWLLAWCGFVPLLIGLENKTLRQAFLISFFCGVFFWGLTVYWLIHVTLLGQIILVLSLAFYFGFFGCLIHFSRYLSASRTLFFLPTSWVLLEYLRSYLFTGFPWALIGFSQYRNLPIIQIADISGVWGVSFLVLLVNVALYLFFCRRAGGKILLILIPFILLSLGYGGFRLSSQADADCVAKRLKVSVVQGNILQDLKWDKRAAAFILDRYQELTVAAAAVAPDLIIWPESSVPGVWGRDDTEFRQVLALARELDTYLLVGAVAYSYPDYFNSALLISRRGVAEKIYSKLHLVPFGEYIPLKNIFPFLETIAPIGDIRPGQEFTVFRAPADFGVLICFEDLFPELSREFVKQGAGFLVNITNDAWYKKSSAAYQHFAASVFRAVENRVYLVRAANTGISGFIDPAGRILGLVQDGQGRKIFIPGQSSQSISLAARGRTIYNRYGDFFIVFCLLLEIYFVISVFKRKND